uniref:Carbonic anhydrase n=1 Tax=Angiostrongylus cantonensis TaxID=6313 RepID=A0A0K0DF09_ANGCA
MLNVSALGRYPSPIDIVPVITVFDERLQNAEFRVEYHSTGEFYATNTGDALRLIREGNDSELAISFLPEEQYHLDMLTWHWSTEPMNGSEHTIGGVGYAGELHLIHRNTRFSTMEMALKQPNGMLAIAIFLNESHDENPVITPFIELLPNITYKGNEIRIAQFNFGGLFPPPEKTKEFWMYEGSETVEPFRETVQWLIFRSALPISSLQLDCLREIRAGGYDEERETSMVPIRSPQSPNSRTVVCSFRSAAGAPNFGFNKQ